MRIKMQRWSTWLLLFAIVLMWTTVASMASPSNANPRELKALRAALKKQQRLKEQQQQQQQQQQRSKGVVASVSGSGEYVPEAGPWSSTDVNEPSCEQLREMWRQSKRHSRAAEATNEIPQYADPFARAASIYARQLSPEPTMRPRPERRPVVYGRLHSSPPSADSDADRSPRPFDVLRKLSRTDAEVSGSSSSPSSSSSSSSSSGESPVVLYSEEDRSPFPKAPAKGSLQHLRELVREEGAGSAVKGSFQQLRDIVREEQRERDGRPGASADWSDADVGRVVTSPSEHGSAGGSGSGKYSLYAMQGDAPYDSIREPSSSHQYNLRRPSTSSSNSYYSRLSAFGSKSHQRNHNHNSHNNGNRQTMMALLSEAPQEAPASRKPFQMREPPRPRLNSGNSRLAAGSRSASSTNGNNRWSSSDSDDVGVIRGYVVGRSNSNPLLASRLSRRSSASSAPEDREECGVDDDVDICRSHNDCRCSSAGRRCQRGRCVPTKKQQQRQKQKQPKRKQPSPIDDDGQRDWDDDEPWRAGSSGRDESAAQDEQPKSDDADTPWQEERRQSGSGRDADREIQDIIDVLQQIDLQESTD